LDLFLAVENIWPRKNPVNWKILKENNRVHRKIILFFSILEFNHLEVKVIFVNRQNKTINKNKIIFKSDKQILRSEPS
jgi:hypothetical protein